MTANRTCVPLASEDIITQRIDTHIAGTQSAACDVNKHLGNRRPKTPAGKSLPNDRKTRILVLRFWMPYEYPVDG